MEFVAFVGEDKENWGQITALINRIESNKIFLVKNKKAEDFPKNQKCEIIEVNSEKSLLELKSEIMDKLKQRLSKEFEVSLSIASGTGKEHMALISALLSVPVGIRLVVFTKQGLEYIN
ncbi:hypothetical protein J4408_00765 [Candidatus Pacearchaeota archaeon]|nr:hypothetical protein [Candidatus Pacearchaeota archaeon]